MSDEKQAEEFVSSYVYPNKQIFPQPPNCDETGLNFRLLPDVTLASSFEKSADGRKKPVKIRVTLNFVLKCFWHHQTTGAFHRQS